MGNLYIGIICFVVSIYLFFFSAKEENNILGYKSVLHRPNKNIWRWSNKCFGTLAIIGSSIYLIVTIIFRVLSITDYNSLVNEFGVAYIFICIFITEVYTFVRVQKSKNKKDETE
jgi:uncharacterized membrane protein